MTLFAFLFSKSLKLKLFLVSLKIPHENCWDEPREKCKNVPLEKCWDEPRQQCHKVPRQECQDVPTEKCIQVGFLYALLPTWVGYLRRRECCGSGSVCFWVSRILIR
jgi:hypothetical protein